MASNNIQIDASSDTPGSLSSSMSEHDVAQQTSRDLHNRFPSLRDHEYYEKATCSRGPVTLKCTKRLNDVQLIKNRQVYFNRKAKSRLELRCEEKIGKYKLEEAHTSLPSSVRSTLIMTFSPDGRRVASTHGDHRIYICDLNTGKLLDTLEGHPKTPWCLAWHPSNQHILASGCLAGEVRVWDLRSKACESWTSESGSIIASLDFHPKDRVLVIATANDVVFWDWSESEPFARTSAVHEREKVKFVGFDPTGTKLITGISNLPKYAGFGSDSLQSRILDGYLSPRSVETSAENMTQNSEITSNPTNRNTSTASSENSSEQVPISSSAGRRSNASLINTMSTIDADGAVNTNEQDVNYRNTVMFSRVAFLYRQLEGLEDSMRNTSFTPIINHRPVIQTVEDSDSDSGINNRSLANNGININADEPSIQQQDLEDDVLSNDNQSNQATTTQTMVATSNRNENDSDEHANNSSEQAILSNTDVLPASNTFEPHLVTFDESLVQLQLPPLIVNGQIVNLANVMENYPIDIPNQLNYAMQYESINLVNQNFIRISKLMSSARLYRQIVQQILSSGSGTAPHHPNQILTVQSISARSPRNLPNIPIVLRNLQMGSLLASSGFPRTRSNDPIMAIQFRNSARNVPLATICKIDLLAARAVCIMRSQTLVEQTIDDNRPVTQLTATVASTGNTLAPSAGSTSGYHRILGHLHSVLLQIIHAPLTTSNAFTHIASLRVTTERLLQAMHSALNSSDESCTLIRLIHNIAFSLTGRRWSMPLGATLDEIRLDVVHILCVVDLTLHFARQVQLLQMQRITLSTRIEESRHPSAAGSSNALNLSVPQSSHNIEQARNNCESSHHPGAGGSGMNQANYRGEKRKNTDDLSVNKRRHGGRVSKDQVRDVTNGDINNKSNPLDVSNQIYTHSEQDTSLEGRGTGDGNLDPGTSIGSQSSQQTRMNENVSLVPGDVASKPGNTVQGGSTNVENLSSPLGSLTNNPVNSGIQVPISERLLLWNNSQQQVEQSLHRFLVTTAPSMTNSHILVRIYHRLHASPPQAIQLPGGGIIERSIDRASISHHESRRRALSQDHSIDLPDVSAQPMVPLAANGSYNGISSGSRIRAPTAYPVNVAPGQNQGLHNHHQHIPAGLVLEPWQRHPHLHVYARGPGQHLWFNQWTVPFSANCTNYRLQCWNYALSAIPSIKDSRCNILTQKCRLHNDASVDISSDGNMIACLVPREDVPSCLAAYDLKILSLKPEDLGACYYKMSHGHNAVSVCFSPSGSHVVVGLMSHKFMQTNPDEDDLTIAKIYQLSSKSSLELIRDVKIKRNDSLLSLNAIRWMPRGIVYNVGPHHQHRYRMRHMMAP